MNNNFMKSLSEVGGQTPNFLNEKQEEDLDKKVLNESKVPYDYKKEKNDLKRLFLSFESGLNFLILFQSPFYSN